MTGTGTQADPYIPTTLTEFITAVGTARAYVALDSDINAADDPEYMGYLSSAITFNAAELQGNGRVIRGITVQADYFLYTTSSAYPVLRSVDFLDCAHRGGASTFYHSNAAFWIVFRNVRASIKKVGGASATVFNRIDMALCAFDISYTGGPWPNSAISSDSTLDRVTVHVTGLTYDGNAALISNSGRRYISQNAIIFDECRFQQVTLASAAFDYPSYFAFRGCTFGGSITCYTIGRGSVVALDDTAVAVNMQSGWTRATLDQMKDKDWLTSVGFLP